MAEVDFLITMRDLGAVSDAVELRDAAMTASSTTLTSASATFAAEDVGKPIVVGGAGASGAKLATTIATFVSATEVTVADAAAAAVSDAGAVYGSDCSAALQAGLDALVSSKGGTLVVDGLFLLASPASVSFGNETAGAAARLVGSGSDSVIWIGVPGGGDAISISSALIELRNLNFVGVPGASVDARRVLDLNGATARLANCSFYGLAATQGIVYADGCAVATRNCVFGGSFGLGGTVSVIENKNWSDYSDERSQFIDYGYFRGLFYGKSGIGGNLGWIRADSPNGADGARGEGVFRLRGTRLDEGAINGIVVKPTTGTITHVSLEGVRQNVTPAEGGRGIHCEKVQSVVMDQCWQGWATTPALIGHFQDCDTVLIDSLKLSDSVSKLSATNVNSLTLKDTSGVTSFTFSNVNFHPVTSRYGDLALVKNGAISDSDFVSPPALGTLAFDRSNNRLYVKRVSFGGWIYFNMDGGDPLGPELVVNGTFDSGTTGWTSAGGGLLTVVAGALRLANGGIYGRAYQAVPTVVGQQYTVSVSVTGGTAGRLVRVGTTEGQATYLNLTNASGGSGTFTATTTSTYITLMLNSEAIGAYADFDNVSMKAS